MAGKEKKVLLQEIESGGGKNILYPVTASDIIITNDEQQFISKTEKDKLKDIATNANNYSHPTTSGNKHIPSGGSSGQILRWSADGTAVWGADNNTTYSVATTSANGLMSSTDKTKLNGIAEGANKTVVDAALSSTSTNPVQNKAVKGAIDDVALRCKTITLAVANWVQNTSTKNYEYTVTDSTVTANHKVDGKTDLANRTKLKDNETNSFNGGFKIITKQKPTEAVTVNFYIQKVGG